MSSFKNFIKELEQELGNKLPGELSQLKMAPITRLMEMEREQTKVEPRKSAVLILFYPEHGKIKLLFIKRAVDKTVHSGQISFPGGKFEKNDLDLRKTALREAEEEIGVASGEITIIGLLSKLYIPPSNFDVHPFVGFVQQKPMLKANHEVQHILQVDFKELRKPTSRTEKAIFHRSGKEVVVPSYSIQNEVIWGATAMILAELIEVSEGF